MKNFLHSPRYYSALLILLIKLEAFHSVRLSCTCLTICEDCCVVTMEHANYCRAGCLLINFNLAVRRSIDKVEAKWVICDEIFISYKILLSTFFCSLLTQVLLNVDYTRSFAITTSRFIYLSYRHEL